MHRINRHDAQELGTSLLDAVDLIKNGADVVQIVSVGNAKMAIATDTFINCDYQIEGESTPLRLAVSNEK